MSTKDNGVHATYDSSGETKQVIERERLDEEESDSSVIRRLLNQDHEVNRVAKRMVRNYLVNVQLSEHEARIVGNRLWERAEEFRETGETHVADETEYLARKFHAKANTRDKRTPEQKEKFGGTEEIEVEE